MRTFGWFRGVQRQAVGAALAVLALAVAGCGSGSTTAATRTSAPTLTEGQAYDYGDVNPAKHQGVDFDAIAYAPLVYPNPDGTYRAGLATSWGYVNEPGSQPNSVYELTLRHDARFSDGSPVNAEAVATWLRYFANANGPFANWIAGGSFDPVNEWTIRIHLPAPNPILPYPFSVYTGIGFVASPNGVANPSMLSTNTFGAGPYKLDPSQSVFGDHYTYVPNKYYYDRSAIKWSKVTVKILPNPTSILEALKAGQLDVAGGDASTADAAAAAGFSVTHAPTQATGFAIMDRGGNVTKALADVRVRQALNYAVDRKAITNAIAGKYGTPTSEINITGAWDPKYQNYYTYDPARAKALLAAAGYPNGFTMPVIDLGNPLTQAIAKYLGAIGVTVKFSSFTNSGEYARQLSSGTYSAYVGNFGSPRAFVFYKNFLRPNSVYNQSSWDDPTITDLFQQASAASDGTPYWQQMMDRTVTEADFLPIYSPHWMEYSSRHVGGVRVSPSYLPLTIDLHPQ